MKIAIILLIIMSLLACEKETPERKDDNEPEQEGLIHNLGLQVNTEGVVTLNGQAYKGVGINYFDAFYRNIKDASDETYKDRFHHLKENNIPFVRFTAGAF
jgi:hypothetical protein